MIVDRLLGPAAPELGWVPAPRYLMRRARIMRMFSDVVPGRLLEIGSGAGALLIELSKRGFRCEALESSAQARQLLQSMSASSGVNIPAQAVPANDWGGAFDVLCAFDVLEHIEDDRSALLQWREWLKPGAKLLLSVPAHMKLWSAGDVWAGHFRRYERRGLQNLFADCGLRIETFECYGFPLTNLGERIATPSYAKRLRANTASNRQQNNDRSGTDRGPHLKLYPLLRSPIGKLGLRTFFTIQNAFISTNLGTGYLVMAHPR